MDEQRIIAAIDPDADKSGIAYIKDDSIHVESISFVDLMERFYEWGLRDEPAKIFVEAGWMNKSVFHYLGSAKRGASIGVDVGRNHETGRKIAEMASRYYNFDVELVRPFRKCWQGKDGKITAEEISRLTGYNKRTNQDERDALLILYYNTQNRELWQKLRNGR